MKHCNACKTTKLIKEFYKHPASIDGYMHQCKECKKSYEKNNKNYIKYEKTEKGVVRVIYKTQRTNSKRRGHESPSYTKEEFKKWLYDNGYKKLYDRWEDSGYEKSLKPSVDRINDFIGYSLQNIRLVTWKENKDKQTDDILLGRSTSGARCKPVMQYSIEGKLIGEFVSMSEARRATGVLNIDMVCSGKRATAGGYKWNYKF